MSGIHFCWVEGFPSHFPLWFFILGSQKILAFCSWIVTLQALWFFIAPLGTWEGHICSSFLIFRGTPLKLSQSHVSYATHLEDPEPLVTSGYPGPILSLDFAGFFNGLFAGNLNIHRALMLILLVAWIGPSLLFMERAFLWNFGPQHTLLIDLYLWGYSWYMSLFCSMWNQEVIFVLLVFSTHASMHLLSVSGNIQVDSVMLLSTLATDR